MNFDAYIGKPYDIANKTGYSCWGLVKHLYDELGISAPDFPSATNTAEAARAIKYAMETDGWVELAQPEEFCVVAMCDRGTICNHVGIFLEGAVLHASRTGGVVHQYLSTIRRKTKRIRFYKWAG